jgi:type III secretory pathway component EscT
MSAAELAAWGGWGVVVLGLRGLAAVLVLTTLVGGMPRIAQVALAGAMAAWSATVLVGAVVGAGALGGLVGNSGAVIGAPLWALALHELAIGAALGVLAAIPLLAAAAAGRVVDVVGGGRVHGPYTTLFAVLAAAVFVGVDGHVVFAAAIVESHRSMPVLAEARPAVLAAIGMLVPVAVRLAVPWLVTAAVVHIAIGVGTRVAARSGSHVPTAVAVPAALTMMTAALVATLAIAIAALVRHAP